MIEISSQHKSEIKSILKNYREGNFDSVLVKMLPILREYHRIDPNRISKRLLDSLFTSWLSQPNEAMVHYWTICQLIEEYRYPADHIDHEVSCGGLGRKALEQSDTKADIVIYSHPSRRPGTALVVVECRHLGGRNGEKQAASYSRSLHAPYHLFTDSKIWSAFETQPHPVDGNPVSDIPHWVGATPLAQRLSKDHALPSYIRRRAVT